MLSHVWYLGQQWSKVRGTTDDLHMASTSHEVVQLVPRTSKELSRRIEVRFVAQWSSDVPDVVAGYGKTPDEALRALGVALAARLREHYQNENEDFSDIMKASIAHIEMAKK